MGAEFATAVIYDETGFRTHWTENVPVLPPSIQPHMIGDEDLLNHIDRILSANIDHAFNRSEFSADAAALYNYVNQFEHFQQLGLDYHQVCINMVAALKRVQSKVDQL